MYTKNGSPLPVDNELRVSHNFSTLYSFRFLCSCRNVLPGVLLVHSDVNCMEREGLP
jgi:hypothetical protein